MSVLRFFNTDCYTRAHVTRGEALSSEQGTGE